MTNNIFDLDNLRTHREANAVREVIVTALNRSGPIEQMALFYALSALTAQIAVEMEPHLDKDELASHGGMNSWVSKMVGIALDTHRDIKEAHARQTHPTTPTAQ